MHRKHRVGWALILLVGSAVSPAIARTLEVGPGLTYQSLAKAAAEAHDGDRVTIAPGTYFECAVWRASHLTVEGMGSDADVRIT